MVKGLVGGFERRADNACFAIDRPGKTDPDKGDFLNAGLFDHGCELFKNIFRHFIACGIRKISQPGPVVGIGSLSTQDRPERMLCAAHTDGNIRIVYNLPRLATHQFNNFPVLSLKKNIDGASLIVQNMKG